MPELPEVETTRRGLEPRLQGRRVRRVIVREPRLRWPVPPELGEELAGARIASVRRRAKYLLLGTRRGTAILHLGMSGSLRLLPTGEDVAPHEHVDFVLERGESLRLRDPRRFGAILWTRDAPEEHPLLAHLGPEPLEAGFDGGLLHRRSRGRVVAVRNFLLDARIVVGVGNIYASESLYRAGIHPGRAAGRISRTRYDRLADAVREVLAEAIDRGGTTLRDYASSDGARGDFVDELAVYGREGDPCASCGSVIRRVVLGARSYFHCPRCQR